MDYVNLFVRSIFIENMVFAYFLGCVLIWLFQKQSKQLLGLDLQLCLYYRSQYQSIFLLDSYLLRPGALTWLDASYADVDLSFLSFIMFIAVIASMVQLVEMIVEKFAPALYGALGIFLPLIAVNCAILGGSFVHATKRFCRYRRISCLWCWFRIGFFLAILAISAIREKIAYSNIPAPLRGLGITFIITGLMAIGFMSFMGIKI